MNYRRHDLRHTFITRLAENPNVSEETIRSLAGDERNWWLWNAAATESADDFN
jgi:integrase